MFDRCYAPASWTKPSIASLFTSLYPGTHGVGARSHADLLPDGVETLADYFRDGGYVTASFSANPQATALSNLDQGFDYVFTPNAFSVDRHGSKAGKVCSDDLNAKILPWIEAHHEDPFFLYIHSIDPHRPYLSRPVPSSLARRTNDIDRYDAEIYPNDQEIARIYRKLEQLSLHRRTLFIVTSDHGESFGEHGRHGHGTGVYREEIRIPLILTRQGSIVPQRVADPVHLVDLMPTILKHCGISFDGRSMEGMDLLNGSSDRRGRTIYSQRFTYPEDMEVEDFKGVDSYAVIKNGWKLIVEQRRENEAPRFQLYALDEPETEQNDQSSHKARQVSQLYDELTNHLAEQRRKRRAFVERYQAGDDARQEEPLSVATIERLRSLGYLNSVHVGYSGGRRRRKLVSGRTRAEVARKLAAALRAAEMGIAAMPERLTVGQWLDHWLENVAGPNTRPKTYGTYAYIVREHVAPELGKRPLQKLSPQDIRAFMKRKSEQGLSAKTVKHLRDTLRAAINVAVKDGLVVRNVAAMVVPPRAAKHEMAAFSPQDAHRFLEATRGHRLEALFSVALCLGLRQGEILGLRWADVDLDARQITVRYQLQRIDGKLTLVEPKTERSRRTIALPQLAVSVLLKHRARQDQERDFAGSRWVETGMVFTTGIGTFLDQRNLLRNYYRILDTADVPRLRFHDLRHSAATLLLSQGCHPRVVMDLLGHSSISVTLDTYSHVIPEMRREAADQMDAVFNRVASKLASNSDRTAVQ